MILHLFHANSVVDINWHGENTLWSLFSDFFNVHTAFCRSDDCNTLSCPIKHKIKIKIKIKLSLYITGVLHIIIVSRSYPLALFDG